MADPMKIGSLADWHLDRTHLARQARLDVLVDAIEVRVVLVHHRDDKEDGVFACNRLAEHALCSDLDAGRRAHDAEGTDGRGESGNRVTLEIEEPRCVDEVDLRAFPLGERTPKIDRILSLDLFGGVISQRGTVANGSMAFARPCHEGER